MKVHKLFIKYPNPIQKDEGVILRFFLIFRYRKEETAPRDKGTGMLNRTMRTENEYGMFRRRGKTSNRIAKLEESFTFEKNSECRS